MNSPTLKIVALCLLWLSATQAQAQLSFTRLPANQAFPSVRDIHRDDEGYLWIAISREGLARYDGFEVVNYKHDSENLSSLLSNVVTQVHVDRTGKVWIGTEQGLNRFIPESDSFIPYQREPDNPKSLHQNFIEKIREREDGSLWVLGKQSLNLYHPDSDSFTQYPLAPKQKERNYRFTDFIFDATGRCWLLEAFNDIWSLDLESGAFSKQRVFDHNLKSPKYFYRDSRDALWIGSMKQGLYQFDPESVSARKIPTATDGSGPNGTAISSLLEYPEGKLLLAVGGGGLNIMDLDTERFHYQVPPSSSARGLSSEGIKALHQDKEGLLYVGHARTGIDLHNPHAGMFESFQPNPNPQKGMLTHNIVGCLFEALGGKIFVGTDGGGIATFDPKTRKIVKIEKTPDGLRSDIIRKIDQSSDGLFWITTWNGGVHAAHFSNGEFTLDEQISPKLLEYQERPQWDIEVDRKDRIWISDTSSKIHLLDAKANKIKTFTPPDIGSNFYNPIVTELPSDDIFINSLENVYRFDEASLTLTPFAEANRSTVVCSNSDGSLIYIGTISDGVSVYDRNGKLLKQFDQEDGLPSSHIRAMQTHGENELWVSSLEGLSRIQLSDGSIKHFTEEDGLQGNQFFIDSSCKARDGTLYFGGTQGFTRFYPQEGKLNPILPQIEIDQISLFGKALDFRAPNSPITQHSSSVEKLHLNWKQNFLGFRFKGITMTKPQQNRYAYKLEGFDDDWIHVDANQRFATYTNLDPGEYLFLVKTANNDNLWNDDASSISITIVPPFWRQIWFYCLITLLLASSIYIYIRSREKRLRQDRKKLSRLVNEKTEELREHKEHLEETVEERTRELVTAKEKAEEANELKSQFLANLSHEIRTPLNAVVGFSNLIKETNPDPETRDVYIETIEDNSQQLICLIEDILDYSTLTANQMTIFHKEFPLNEFIESIGRTFQSQAIEGVVELRIQNLIQSDELQLCSDRSRIKQVIDNLLSNAFKFTEKGFVELTLNKEDDWVLFSVRDTGHGIPEQDLHLIFDKFVKLREDQEAARRGVGLGLSISKQLSERLGGSLEVTSLYEVGSTFTLKIPLQPKPAVTGEE